jgi:integrase
MVTLRQDTKGNFSARKRLPDDVREEYGRRYGQRLEAKFFAAASKGAAKAKQEFRDWETEVAGRIAAIRAQRTGEGVALTLRQARALAGEWYEWFLAKHPASDHRKWATLRDELHEAERETVGEAEWERSDPDELWRTDEQFRKAMRPVFADAGDTALFLAMKGVTLNGEAQALFLDWLYEDLAAALRKLIRAAHGDYRDDKYAERFPKFAGSDTGEMPQQLFEAWVIERKPARGTVESWRYVFAEMAKHFKDRSAASISPDEAQDWIRSLVGTRSASTVRKNWITASKTVFGWALEHKRVPRNPFAHVKITVQKKHRLRDTQAFLPDEWRIILRASLVTTKLDTPDDAAKRWVPWLCAYSGARPGEITQLRGGDVIERDGVHGLRITPDAGTVKNKKARVIPIHEHLIEQGFLQFVKNQGAGPMFYRVATHDGGSDPLKAKKPRYAQARQRLADWVRDLGISDPELLPNHAGDTHSNKSLTARASASACLTTSPDMHTRARERATAHRY